eukprot:CAMPEP_0204640568 /NCGR_PEP_ID=MMETSP0717-20131115/47968_1 /ASSEMBLY_ACC=CAM_ASM_000666 /TAXON_ID=230516 /ORGANISM="Chaetoceros curvisetus" /LENGTH=68 /DNA_ID=CAMNT_0051661039 /DNA_START=63 /DNA_END=269 /DNA_ORIENTATION=+
MWLSTPVPTPILLEAESDVDAIADVGSEVGIDMDIEVVIMTLPNGWACSASLFSLMPPTDDPPPPAEL